MRYRILTTIIIIIIIIIIINNTYTAVNPQTGNREVLGLSHDRNTYAA